MLGGSGAPWIARAPAGEVPAGDPRLHLTGGVEGEGRWPDGEALRFRTPELWLDLAKDRLETEAGFELDSPSRSARGGRLAVEGKRQQLVLRNDVTMRYATP
jgi:lipopolysaccharide export system protein LptC